MDERKQIEERVDLENIISDAIRDYEDYCEDCYESGNYRAFGYEESIADAVLSAGYRNRSEVAREIFEEIYDACFDQYGYIDYAALAKLRDKYTDGYEVKAYEKQHPQESDI